MRLHPTHLQAALLALSLPLGWLATGCGGSSAEEGGGPPPNVDITPPFTQATPDGGMYTTTQIVTLSSNEPATIYYTNDGGTPSIGGLTTISGESPISGIVVDHDLSLRFFGVDQKGNQESVSVEFYVIDTTPPNVLKGSASSSLGVLEWGEVNFLSDEEGSWTAEVGGTGVPGSGEFFDSGTAPKDVLVTVDVPGWRLEQGIANTVWVYVSDAAGGIGSASFQIDSPAAETFAMPGATGDLAATSDGTRLFALRPAEGQVWTYDIEPGSPNYHTVLEQIDVGPNPTSMALAPDEAYLYVTSDGQIVEIELATPVVETQIPMPGGVTPSGVAVVPDQSQAFVAGDDGLAYKLALDGSYTVVEAETPSHVYKSKMTAARFAITDTPIGEQLLMAWTGDGEYGAVVFDTEPDVLFLLHTIRGTPVLNGPIPQTLGIPVRAADEAYVYLGDGGGKLALATLLTIPASIEKSNGSLGVIGMKLTPDGEYLLLFGGALIGLRVVDPDSLAEIYLIPADAPNGTGSSLAFSGDGKRAYLVRNEGEPDAEMWVPVLSN